jgi:phospholipid-binding lipoprotein MlaA
MPKPLRALLALSLAAGLAGCAAPPEHEGFVWDPFEETNREIHEFNKGWDTVLIRPASQVYQEITPGVVRLLVGNGLDMLDLPAIFVNNLLQGDPLAALRTAGRFGINMALGGGLLDPATEFGLPKESTDLGVTFAKWGFEEGPYVELPLLGPATTRDAVGRVTEIALDPFNFLTGVPQIEALGPGTAVLGIVELRAENETVIDRAFYETEDSYVTTRSGYVQFRRRRVAGGVTEEQIPDVFAE